MKDKQIINATPDKDGRCIVNLFGKDIEIHESMFDKDGVAELKKFGIIYEIKKPIKKSRKTKKTEKVEIEIEESES